MSFRKIILVSLTLLLWVPSSKLQNSTESSANPSLVAATIASSSSSNTTTRVEGPGSDTTRRVRRQDGGGSTAVVGSRVKREATEGDWEEAKFGSFAPPPPASRRGSSRRRRSLASLLPSISFKKYFSVGHGRPHSPPPSHSHGSSSSYGPPSSSGPKGFSFSIGDSTHVDEDEDMFHGGFDGSSNFDHGPSSPSVPDFESNFVSISGSGFKTRTQQRFNVINRNFVEAENYILSSTIQGNPILRNSLILNPAGITCGELCSGPQHDSTGYAMMGMCTADYCNCGNPEQRQQCPDPDLVFDPVSLSCQSAVNTVLCSELKIRPLIYHDKSGGIVVGDQGQGFIWDDEQTGGGQDEWDGGNGWTK